jgi:hypothetical protein
MQKNNVLPIIIISIILASSVAFTGYCQAPDKAFEQLKSELKSAGVSDEFIKITENSVKKMIAAAAPAADIKTVLLDLWKEETRPRALKNAAAAVAELVANGDNVLEAAKIASGAAHEAESEGLGGFGVGMRVKKAVADRKAYLKTMGK